MEKEQNQLKLFKEATVNQFVVSREARKQFFNVEEQEISEYFKHIYEVNTNGIGLKNKENKENYSFLWWD